MNSTNKTILISLIHLSVFTLCILQVNSNKVPSPSPRLIYLGTFGSKQFYYNPDLTTWNEANELCALNQYTMLVKIESRLERLFLSNVLNAMDQNYWTAGRDIATGNQFGWFGDSGDQVGLVGPESEWYDGNPMPRSCVIFNPYTQVLFNYLCTDKLPSICQSAFE